MFKMLHFGSAEVRQCMNLKQCGEPATPRWRLERAFCLFISDYFVVVYAILRKTLQRFLRLAHRVLRVLGNETDMQHDFSCCVFTRGSRKSGVERLPCPWPLDSANACLALSGPVVFLGTLAGTECFSWRFTAVLLNPFHTGRRFRCGRVTY